MDFQTVLIVSLQIDYLMSLLNFHGEDTLEFYLPKELYGAFKQMTDNTQIDAGFYEANDDLGFILEFHSPEAQERFIEVATGFNHNPRKSFEIPMPNLYMGKEEIDTEVLKTYLDEIKEFFGNEFEGAVRIPVGKNGNNIAYCVCDQNGIQ